MTLIHTDMTNETTKYWGRDVPSPLSKNESRKYAYFVAVNNSKNKTIPYDATLSDDKTFVKDGYFGFHVIDKTMEIKETFSWSMFLSIPFYDFDNITDNGDGYWGYDDPNKRSGQYLNMCGAYVGTLYNGIPQRYEEKDSKWYTYFEEQTFGDAELIITTDVDGSERDIVRKPKFEDKMPVKRHISGIKFTDDLKSTIIDTLNEIDTYGDYTDYINAINLLADDTGLKYNFGLQYDGGDNNYAILVEDAEGTIRDGNGCTLSFNGYGLTQVYLSSDSMNDCVDRSATIFKVETDGGAEVNTFYAYDAIEKRYITNEDNQPCKSLYPLRYASQRPSLESIPFYYYDKSNCDNPSVFCNIFDKDTDEATLLSKVTTTASGVSEEYDDNGDEILTPGYSTTGEFRLETNYTISTNGALFKKLYGDVPQYNQGAYYVVLSNSDNCRSISPVYDFSYLGYKFYTGTCDYLLWDGTSIHPIYDVDAVGLNVAIPTKTQWISTNKFRIPYYFSYYPYSMYFKFKDSSLTMYNSMRFMYPKYSKTNVEGIILPSSMVGEWNINFKIDDNDLPPDNVYHIPHTQTISTITLTVYVKHYGQLLNGQYDISITASVDSNMTIWDGTGEVASYTITWHSGDIPSFTGEASFVIKTPPETTNGNISVDVDLTYNDEAVNISDMIVIVRDNEGETTEHKSPKESLTDAVEEGLYSYARDISTLRHHLVQAGTTEQNWKWMGFSFDPNGGVWKDGNDFTTGEYYGNDSVFMKLVTSTSSRCVEEVIGVAGSYDRPILEREGYIFNGWIDVSDEYKKTYYNRGYSAYNGTECKTITADVPHYFVANWLQRYEVTFVLKCNEDIARWGTYSNYVKPNGQTLTYYYYNDGFTSNKTEISWGYDYDDMDISLHKPKDDDELNTIDGAQVCFLIGQNARHQDAYEHCTDSDGHERVTSNPIPNGDSITDFQILGNIFDINAEGHRGVRNVFNIVETDKNHRPTENAENIFKGMTISIDGEREKPLYPIYYQNYLYNNTCIPTSTEIAPNEYRYYHIFFTDQKTHTCTVNIWFVGGDKMPDDPYQSFKVSFIKNDGSSYFKYACDDEGTEYNDIKQSISSNITPPCDGFVLNIGENTATVYNSFNLHENVRGDLLTYMPDYTNKLLRDSNDNIVIVEEVKQYFDKDVKNIYHIKFKSDSDPIEDVAYYEIRWRYDAVRSDVPYFYTTYAFKIDEHAYVYKLLSIPGTQIDITNAKFYMNNNEIFENSDKIDIGEQANGLIWIDIYKEETFIWENLGANSSVAFNTEKICDVEGDRITPAPIDGKYVIENDTPTLSCKLYVSPDWQLQEDFRIYVNQEVCNGRYNWLEFATNGSVISVVTRTRGEGDICDEYGNVYSDADRVTIVFNEECPLVHITCANNVPSE